MTNYVVKANVELEAASLAEAEELVLGLEIYDLEGKPVENVYVEIDEVRTV